MADRIPLVIEGSQIREISNGDRIDISGNALQVGGHITPDTDSSYDIGTSSLKFRDIYLSSGTIHLGGVKLRADGNKLSIQDSTGSTAGITAATLGTLGTDDLAEGSTNLFTTAARTRSHLQVTDAGGDGSFAFDSASGKFTYTGPSAAEARAHLNVATGTGLGSLAYDSARGQFTLTGITQANVMSTMQAGTGVGIDSASGTLSIGQPVGTTDSVTFAGLYSSGNVVLGGNLTVNGTTTTVNATNSLIADPLIELNTGAGSNANDLGFVFERGSTGDNAALIWDESEDKFKIGTTTATGASTGNMTVTTGSLIANLVGNVTGNVSGSAGSATGNAATATALATARAIALSGDVVGTADFDGTAGISISTTIQANSVALGTDTTGNYVGTITGGTGITSSGATSGEGIAHTISITAGSISSTQLASASTLTIKNTSGTVLKTVIGAGS